MEPLYTVKNLVSINSFNQLVKVSNEPNDVDWHMPDTTGTSSLGYDRYFTAGELIALPPLLREFVCSDFCEVTEL